MPPSPLRKTLDRLFSFFALVAVLFNFLAPVTHGFMASADASEYVQICTKNGIELLPLSASAYDVEGPKLRSECNTCPLCQIGKGHLLAAPKVQVFDFQYLWVAKTGPGYGDDVSILPFQKYDLTPRAPPFA